MKVTACVISWNSGPQLATALDSLVTQDHPDLDVVVIDNASVDGSAELVRRRGDVRLVVNPANLGYAGGANQAVALADAAASDAVLVCNFDVRLRPDYVRRAVEALQARAAVASVQGKLLRPATATGGDPVIDTTGHVAFRTRLFRNRGEGQPAAGVYTEAGPVFGVSGAVALYRLAALHDIALDGAVFDTDLFAYWEDVDVDWRLALRGWQAWYTPAAVAWHERGGAGPRRSATVERLNFVNRFHVIVKNDHLPSLGRALPGVALTTTLKAGELVLTVPSAFLRALPELRHLQGAVRKRRRIQAVATVDPAEVVTRWFEPFDYGAWVRTWWRRIRSEAAPH